MKKQKDINLIAAYKNQGKDKAISSSSGRVYLLVFIMTAVILGAFYIKLWLDQSLLDGEVGKLEEYVNSPARLDQLDEITNMQDDVASLKAMETELKSLTNVMDQIPRFDRRVINVIALNKTSDMEILDITYDGEWVAVNVTSMYLPSMSNYVLELERSGAFSDVYYNGYSANDGKYSGTVYVALKGNPVVNEDSEVVKGE